MVTWALATAPGQADKPNQNHSSESSTWLQWQVMGKAKGQLRSCPLQFAGWISGRKVLLI
jgi:hypothetical protein